MLRYFFTDKPKFHCLPQQKVAVHTTNYELSCDVLTNPEIKDVKFEFEWNGKMETLTPGQSTSDGEIKFLQKKVCTFERVLLNIVSNIVRTTCDMS